MKIGKLSLSELAMELQRQTNAKEDVVANTNQMRFDSNSKSLIIGDSKQFDTITDNTHQQIGTWAKIPKPYYDKMRQESPALLSLNVNEWLHKSDSRRMVRTIDGKARAFLSDRYRRIDNDIIAEQALATLLNMPNIDASNIASCDVTDKKLYLKVVFKHITGEVKVGDQVESGIMITNSEIGLGGFNVQPFIHRLVCLNGMTVNDASINRKHIGSRLQGTGVISYQDDTLKADDRALMLELRDTILASGDQTQFNKYLDMMRQATQGEKVKKPVEAVEVLAKTFSFNESEKNSVLENLIKDQDYSRWGVLNAVTAVANEHPDYDRATELESLGGKILTLKPSEWRTISEAA